MSFIKTTPPGEATGRLAAIYAAAVQRAGKVYKILQIQSPNPEVLTASMQLYIATMFAPSPLSRAEREALAVVVSRINHCRY
jgi:alkylhydroperoxidase family enzyme